MDTSREFIKMCSNAVDIQIKFKGQNGDYFAYQNSVYLLDSSNNHHIFICYIGEHYDAGNIWLPRQDQLQEMYKFDKEISPYKIIKVLGQIFEIGSEYYRHFNSMEQLWLAFIMHELYQKFWDGSDWVKEKKDE